MNRTPSLDFPHIKARPWRKVCEIYLSRYNHPLSSQLDVEDELEHKMQHEHTSAGAAHYTCFFRIHKLPI